MTAQELAKLPTAALAALLEMISDEIDNRPEAEHMDSALPIIAAADLLRAERILAAEIVAAEADKRAAHAASFWFVA